MLDWLGDLIVRMIPVAIPIILIWSFLINHDLAPSGKSKGEGGEKPKGEKNSKASSGSTPPASKDTQGPEG